MIEAWITVVVALIVALSTLGATLIQNKHSNKRSERQRKWALEDEERRKACEHEAEQRSIKRELLCKRLDSVEAAIKIMMHRIGRTVSGELGLAAYDDKDVLLEEGKRLQSIRDEAWAALVALDSQDLMEKWRAIASAYWEDQETGTVSSESWKKSEKAYVEAIRLTDEMRSQV